MSDRIYNSILVVSIEQVKQRRDKVESVRKFMDILQRQGLIEPMQVKVLGENQYTTFEQDPWSDNRIEAAKRLGWKTLLICPMRVFEE